ncbi:hypothetical protein HNY73_017309 [Argiope bruennichi]|uniref:Uncharacterized protein n=1 Tax=Argiope bruennichi TaxID=94029 RepID=A0A8T0EQ70_ARGBR|nr:hypothetical protein HNY73_017309 [Argiope bruennichi]
MESDKNKTDREQFADDSDILTDDENLFYSPKGAGMIIPDTPTPIKGLTYKDFKKSSDSDSNEIIEPSMQTDSKIQMATKRKKKNVKMKTGENRPKDKRPCIPRKGKEKERNDGIANTKKAKNVDASENEIIPEENKQPFGPLGILETFENIINKYRIEGNAAEELRDLFLNVLSNSSATKMNSTDDNQGPTFVNEGHGTAPCLFLSREVILGGDAAKACERHEGKAVLWGLPVVWAVLRKDGLSGSSAEDSKAKFSAEQYAQRFLFLASPPFLGIFSRQIDNGHGRPRRWAPAPRTPPTGGGLRRWPTLPCGSFFGTCRPPIFFFPPLPKKFWAAPLLELGGLDRGVR